MPDVREILVALGANSTLACESLSDRLNTAVVELKNRGINTLGQSRTFRTPSFPIGSGPDYVNAAIAVETSFSAPALLAVLHEVEASLGRERAVRWGARTLDLDLLAYGDTIDPDPATYAHWRDLPLERQMQEAPDRLILPHPRIQDRAFVLIPLLDIAPDWTHPVSGLTVRQMVDALPDPEKSAIIPL